MRRPLAVARADAVEVNGSERACEHRRTRRALLPAHSTLRQQHPAAPARSICARPALRRRPLSPSFRRSCPLGFTAAHTLFSLERLEQSRALHTHARCTMPRSQSISHSPFPPVPSSPSTSAQSAFAPPPSRSARPALSKASSLADLRSAPRKFLKRFHHKTSAGSHDDLWGCAGDLDEASEGPEPGMATSVRAPARRPCCARPQLTRTRNHSTRRHFLLRRHLPQPSRRAPRRPGDLHRTPSRSPPS